MKVKIISPVVYRGSVYPAGSELDVPSAKASQWIDQKKAEAIVAAKEPKTPNAKAEN